MTLYEGEGPSGSNGARLTLLRISILHSTTHNQTGPLWCWFPSKWACAHSRPLCVSPRTSPVRLGVSPAAVPTPTGVFNQRFEALFPGAGALGCMVCLLRCPQFVRFICGRIWCRGVLPTTLHALFSASLSPALLVYLCANVGPQGLLVVGLPAHTPPVSVPPGPWESSPPRCPSPPLLLVWMNVNFFISFVSDSLAVRFSVSSGCARRCSVSTYAAILVLLVYFF